MVGFGRVGGTELGTLNTITNVENKFLNLVDEVGAWTVRNDVMYRGVISAIGDGPLTPGFGANSSSFGPELGFGHVMGYYHDEPVLLIKTSIGNRSIGWDCLPPGSVSYVYNDINYAGYGDYGNWPVGDDPPTTGGWYAGKQYDDFFLDEADMGPKDWVDANFYTVGCQVRNGGIVYNCKVEHTSSATSEPGIGGESSTYWDVHSVFNVTDILDNFASEYPQYATQGFEIAGFVWWQGHKDQGEPYASRYEFNMVNFIKKLRQYYENRYPDNIDPNAPFVLATIAFGGWDLSGAGLTVANGQLAVSGETGNYPEFAGNVKTMEARGYWRDYGPSTQGYHYNHNAETYMLVSDALGRAMVELLSTTYSVFGDCNKDGRVDFKDLAALALYWLQTNCGRCGGADLTGDEQVDNRDVAEVAKYWLTATTIPPLPEQASNPNPTDNATGANLSWTAGSGATSHDVYFGTSDPPPFISNQSLTTFDPGELSKATKFYWRIDEINGWGKTGGLLWSFTTTTGPPPS